MRDKAKYPEWGLEVLLALVFLVTFITPRINGTDTFATIDEPHWLWGGANYYFALGQQDWAETYHDGHPGMTTVIEAGFGIWQTYPYYRITAEYFDGPRKFNRFIKSVDGVELIDLLSAGRKVAVVVNAITLLFAYAVARKLFGRWETFTAFILIALDPFHAAHTRLLHQDGQIGCFIFTSILAFSAYLWDSRRWYYLLLSDEAARLAWLTKTPGYFLIPVVGLMTFFVLIQDLRTGLSGDADWILKAIKRYVLPGLAWLLIGVMVFVILFPAVWVEPKMVYEGMRHQARDGTVGGHEHPQFFNDTVLKGESFGLLYYPITFLWRTTPVILLGLLLAILAAGLKLPPFDRSEVRRYALILLLYGVGFMFFMRIGKKQFDRYILPSYNPLDFLAGLGWVAVLFWLASAKRSWIRLYSPAFMLALVVGVQSIGVMQTYPYYLTYYNPIMGGGEGAVDVMYIGYGEGYREAAEYMMQKTDFEELDVKVWTATAPFAFFYPKDENGMSIAEDGTSLEGLQRADYFLLYINRYQVEIRRRHEVMFVIEQLEPEHIIWIDEIPYVFIYDMQNVPPELFDLE